MAKRDDYVSLTEKLATPIAKELSLEIVDVEWVKEGSNYYLRIYADKEGGIGIDDCEALSRACEVEIDKEDYIKEPYIFEVSSPGLTRPLKKDKDFKRNLGKMVELKTFKAHDSIKEFEGILKDFDEKTVTIAFDGDETMVFERNDLALIRLSIEF